MSRTRCDVRSWFLFWITYNHKTNHQGGSDIFGTPLSRRKVQLLIENLDFQQVTPKVIQYPVLRVILVATVAFDSPSTDDPIRSSTNVIMDLEVRFRFLTTHTQGGPMIPDSSSSRLEAFFTLSILACNSFSAKASSHSCVIWKCQHFWHS